MNAIIFTCLVLFSTLLRAQDVAPIECDLTNYTTVKNCEVLTINTTEGQEVVFNYEKDGAANTTVELKVIIQAYTKLKITSNNPLNLESNKFSENIWVDATVKSVKTEGGATVTTQTALFASPKDENDGLFKVQCNTASGWNRYFIKAQTAGSLCTCTAKVSGDPQTTAYTEYDCELKKDEDNNGVALSTNCPKTLTFTHQIKKITITDDDDCTVNFNKDHDYEISVDTTRTKIVILSSTVGSRTKKIQLLNAQCGIFVSDISVNISSSTCISNDDIVMYIKAGIITEGFQPLTCGSTYNRIYKDSTKGSCSCTLVGTETSFDQTKFNEHDCKQSTNFNQFDIDIRDKAAFTYDTAITVKSLTSTKAIAISCTSTETPLPKLTITEEKQELIESITNADINIATLTAPTDETKANTISITKSTVYFGKVNGKPTKHIFDVVGTSSTININAIEGSCQNDECELAFVTKGTIITKPEGVIFIKGCTNCNRILYTSSSSSPTYSITCTADKTADTFEGQFTDRMCPCSTDDQNTKETSCSYATSLAAITLKGRTTLKENLVINSDSDTTLNDVTAINHLETTKAHQVSVNKLASADNVSVTELKAVTGGSFKFVDKVLLTTLESDVYVKTGTIATHTFGKNTIYLLENADFTITALTYNSGSALSGIAQADSTKKSSLTITDFSSTETTREIVLLDTVGRYLTLKQSAGKDFLSCDNLMLFTKKSTNCEMYHEFFHFCTATTNSGTTTADCGAFSLPQQLTIPASVSGEVEVSNTVDKIICQGSSCSFNLKKEMNPLITTDASTDLSAVATLGAFGYILSVSKVGSLNVKGESTRLSVAGSVQTLEYSGSLTLVSYSGEDLTVHTNLEVRSSLVLAGSLIVDEIFTASGAQVSVAGTMTVKEIKVSQTTHLKVGGAFNATTLSHQETGTQCFLLYDITSFTGAVKHAKSCLKTTAETTKACYTQSGSVFLDQSAAYRNDLSHGCATSTDDVIVSSGTTLVSSLGTHKSIIIDTNVDINSVMKGISFSFTQATPAHKLALYSDESIDVRSTLSADATKDGFVTIYKGGNINSFNNMKIMTTEAVEAHDIINLELGVDTNAVKVSNGDDKQLNAWSTITQTLLPSIFFTGTSLIVPTTNTQDPLVQLANLRTTIGADNYMKCTGLVFTTSAAADDYYCENSCTITSTDLTQCSKCDNEFCFITLDLTGSTTDPAKITTQATKLSIIGTGTQRTVSVDSAKITNIEIQSGKVKLVDDIARVDVMAGELEFACPATATNNAYIVGSDGAQIKVVNNEETAYKVWSFNVDSLEISGNLNVIGAFVAKSLTVSSGKIQVGSNVNIAALNIQSDSYQSSALFMADDVPTLFTINSVNTNDRCAYIANFQSSTRTLSDVKITGSELEKRIFFTSCTTKPTVAECIVATGNTNVDLQERTMYTTPGICDGTDFTIPIKFEDTGDTEITISGIESDLTKITLPKNAILKTQQTSKILIKELVVGSKVTLESPFSFQTLTVPSDVTSSVFIVLQSVEFSGFSDKINLKLSTTSDITFNNEVTVNEIDTTDAVSTVVQSKNKVTVNSLKFTYSQDITSALLKGNFDVKAVEMTGTSTVSVPVVQMTSGTINTVSPLISGCRNTLLFAKGTDSYVCPAPYSASTSDNHETASDFVQQYIYTTSADLTLNGNTGKTNGYDIVNVNGDHTVTISNSGVYKLVSTTGTTKIQCTLSCDVLLSGAFEIISDNVVIQESGESAEVTVKGVKAVVNGLSSDVLSITMDGGILQTIGGQSRFKDLTLNGDSLVNATSSFELTSLTINSGKIVLNNKSNFVGITTFYYKGTSALTTCTNLISYSNNANRGDLAFSIGTISQLDSNDIVITQCGGTELKVCKATTTAFECPELNCKVENSPTACYCQYDLVTKQTCTFNCETNEPCTFNDDKSKALFQSITFVNTLTLLSTMSVYDFTLTSADTAKTIDISSSLNIYTMNVVEISSIAFTGVSLNVESLKMTGGNLNLKNKLSTFKAVNLKSGAMLLENQLTIPSTDVVVEVTGAAAIPREFVIDSMTVDFAKSGYVDIKGGLKDEKPINKVIIKDTTFKVDVTDLEVNTISRYLIELEETGEVELTRVKVELTGETTKKCVAILRVNDINKITLVESDTLKIDTQKYLVYVCSADGNVEIPPLSCSLSTTDEYSSVKESDWERKTCPCEGNECIITFQKQKKVTYTIPDNTIYGGLYIGSGSVSGNAVTLSTVKVSGNAIFSLTSSAVKDILVGETEDSAAFIAFDQTISIGKISGMTKSETNTLIMYSGHLVINESMTGINLDVRGGSLYKIDEEEVDFNGNTVSIDSQSFVDVYSNKVDFTNSKLILTPSAGQSAGLNFDDDVKGKSIDTISKMKIEVNVDKSKTGVLYALIRLPLGTSLDMQIDIIDTNPSPSGHLKGEGLRKVAACGGFVVTDMPDGSIVCPTDRLARSVETKEFPKWTIALIVIFVVALVVVVLIFIIYCVIVYLQRKRNLKVFEEGEEIDVEDEKKEEKAVDQAN
ncbi:hypothetical protein EIN_184540 [Entamoeba invadens IP1]|uniref:hypothetical protein n=1 Tax=Entamoeba invadens IP1 TaxID=370355 RepID=UPI0002C3D861|nr:hypothetical protein EIN_184540 [Entamoeba invadens IP1]ELP94097.1 hypothetical protein EIN_184540 [Entamoeba invadens IP1]|eukprot:XP_004260868.1 hypothetical protein EIN_184540 [Entamoeba invadens IP1]